MMLVSPILDQFATTCILETTSTTIVDGYVSTSTATQSIEGVIIMRPDERYVQDRKGIEEPGTAWFYHKKDDRTILINVGDTIIDSNGTRWRVGEKITYANAVDICKYRLIREEP